MNTRLLIVGLGNPGKHYDGTRHNVGATWVRKLCSKYTVTLKSSCKLSADLANINPNVICLISHEYMNNSGFGVKKAIDYYKIDSDNALIIHDDLDLAIGDIRFKKTGGHGGHNGLKSIMEHLKTSNFKRLRIGIGHPGVKEQVVNYVLNKPDPEEQSIINDTIDYSLQIIPELLTIESINWQKIEQILKKNFGDKRNGI